MCIRDSSRIDCKEWTSDSITLQWGHPASKPSPITSMFGQLTHELQWRSQMAPSVDHDAGPWCMASDTLTNPVVKKKNLKDGQIYAFRVRSKNEMGWGSYSRPVVFRAGAGGHQQFAVFHTLDVRRLSRAECTTAILFALGNLLSNGCLFAFHLKSNQYHSQRPSEPGVS
eukprot:TRINITY_DN20556_c0_g1_i2.p1 TRINITY_DN20556_c0_g1~~TRINITY_DN20556_c0_g1_i2.p1  ORF type:complete len:170 (+),score=26.83 TRINITY_DN20556_c0_g1_i2:148-657(+)